MGRAMGEGKQEHRGSPNLARMLTRARGKVNAARWGRSRKALRTASGQAAAGIAIVPLHRFFGNLRSLVSFSRGTTLGI
jgi:hypothetical protein